MIIAMAGHVDHGKTSLIRALTGIDPDRLPDERRRGMTIDLGFAHARLGTDPASPLIGFVDVPGHERFLGNMLAGVMGVDTALLIIAADDGPMPQTVEHLAILRLIGITDLTVALSKIDRVDAEHFGASRARVVETLVQAGFPTPPIIPVSSQTGAGLDALAEHLSAKASDWRPRASAGRFRLSVDRAFVVDGTGLVVTGTVIAGSLGVGDRLILSPRRLAARVRGLQRHYQATDQVSAGDRCALAIAGPQIERGRIRRGDWLVDPALHAPTQRLDATIQGVAGQSLRHGVRVHIHLGAAAIPGRAVTFSGRDLVGEDLVSLTLDRPVAALWDDRIVLRDEGSGRVVGGGRVIDPFPPSRRVRRESRTGIVAALGRQDVTEAMTALLAADGWVDLGALALARNLAPATLTEAASALPARLVGGAARPILLADDTARGIATRITERLATWHRDHPDLPGPAKATLLSGLAMLPAEVIETVLRDLLARGAIVSRTRALALPEHQPTLTPADAAAWGQIESVLRAPDLRPPRVRELAVTLGLDPVATEQLLVRLERFGLILRVAPNRFFLPETVAALGVIAETMAREAEAEGTDGFNAGAYSQRSGIGRNLTIQVLEFLDRAGLTRRNGQFRYVLRPVAEVFG